MRGIIFQCWITTILLVVLAASQRKYSRSLLQLDKSAQISSNNFISQDYDIAQESIPKMEDDYDDDDDVDDVQSQKINFAGGEVFSLSSNDLGYYIDDGGTDALQSLVARLILPIGENNNDERKKIDNTERYPFYAVGLVGSPTGPRCTGTAIGPYHVLTAAHCVYDRFLQTFYPDIDFTPAQNGYTSPYKTYPWTFAFIPDKFFSQDFSIKKQNDYALIILSEKISPEITPLEFGNSCQQQFLYLNIAGYPSDKEFKTMYSSACVNVEYQCGWKTFMHTCDTFRGMSGGSMFVTYRKMDGSVGHKIRAIHTGYNSQLELNEAVVVTEEVEEEIKVWMDTFIINEVQKA